MKHALQGLLFTSFVVFFTACQTLQPVTTVTVKKTDKELYQSSIEESMSPAPSKVYNNLVPITKDNKNLVWKTIDSVDYLLMLTWKQNVSYFKPYVDSAYYNTGNYPIWVTSAPQLLQTMKADTMQDVNMRLKQLLGLPPTAEYSYFVELWVNPADIFRPCPDKEINDKACELCMPKNADSTHIAWINENRISRYYACDLYAKYPWTQLGYTYDWNANNTSHVGLSEFVIRENKNIKVKAIYTTQEYLGK
jgi:hypothetical protein